MQNKQHAVVLNQGSIDAIKDNPIGAVVAPVPQGAIDQVVVPAAVTPAPAAAVTPANAQALKYFYNSTQAPIMVPEWNMVLPGCALSAPVPVSTEVPPSLAVHIGKGVSVMYTQPNFEMGDSSRAVSAVSKPHPSERPVTEAPNVVTAKSEVVAKYDRLTVVKPVASTPEERLNALKDENGNVPGAVRDAVEHTRVEIRDDGEPGGPSADDDEATMILKSHSKKQRFASEVPVAKHVASEAAKLSDALAKAGPEPKPAPAAAIATGSPEMDAWLAKPIVFKKVAVFKSADQAFLQSVLASERDVNVLACVRTRIEELNAK